MHRLLLMTCALLALPAQAQTPASFETWLAEFRQEAATQGISAATLDAALTGVEPTTRVVELDRKQPEFQQTFADYLNRRVTAGRVARGQALLQQHVALLDQVEARFGVPKSILVAFWGLETNFGATMGSHNIPASLATLAYDGRRSQFFRDQLLDALRIIDAGHVQAVDMTGSWAGAMGHMQFMPSTFRAYALDGDNDGRINVWQSLPDAMTSAGNYLKRAGWRPNEPVALEVLLPEGFDWRQSRGVNRLPVAEWAEQGVLLADGLPLPRVDGRAGIVLPQGWQGPAFMVFDNFDVVMRWNRSVSYALSVAQLAHQIDGGRPISAPMGDATALSTSDLIAMQQALNDLGYDAGPPDGVLGPRTQAALRIYQIVNDLPADGFPSTSVMAHVAARHAERAATGQLAPSTAPTFADPEDAP